MAFEQSADNFFAFGHENTLYFVFNGPAHRGVWPQFRRIEGRDFLNAKHREIFSVPIATLTGVLFAVSV